MAGLYVCEFSDGTVKVGRSTRPAKRVVQHKSSASRFGLSLERHHAVECVAPAAEAERALIEQCCSASASQRGREWFYGLQFDTVCAWADAAASTAPRKPADSDAFNPWAPRRVRSLLCSATTITFECRACRSSVPSYKDFGDGFLCNACKGEGYRFKPIAGASELLLHGIQVPLWSREPDPDWPMLIPVRQIDSAWPHPDGRPAIDVAGPAAAEVE